jgi:hypothetical protein
MYINMMYRTHKGGRERYSSICPHVVMGGHRSIYPHVLLGKPRSIDPICCWEGAVGGCEGRGEAGLRSQRVLPTGSVPEGANLNRGAFGFVDRRHSGRGRPGDDVPVDLQ